MGREWMRERKTGITLKRPLFWGGLTAVAVTAVALRFSLWFSVLFAVALCGWFCHRRAGLCALLAVCFLLLSVGYRHLYITPTRSLDGQTDTVVGVVEERSSYGSLFTLRVTDSAFLRQGTRVVLLCDGEEKPTRYATVQARVRLYAVEDAQSYFASQGAFVRAYAATFADKDIKILDSAQPTLYRWLYRLRLALVTPCRKALGQPESSILAAVCFGERTFLSSSTEEAFRGSGLSHLLVVSGLHVSMVALALRGLLRRLGRRRACLLTLVGVWLYACLVGFSPSVLRAAAMCSVWLVGHLLFRRADGLNSMGLAALLIIAFDPCSVWDAGFQLSFAATMGVLLLAPRLMPRYERSYDLPWWLSLWQSFRRTAVSAAVVCVSALLFTLPIAVTHFEGFSLATVVSNVLAVVPIGGMMALCWLGTLFGLIPFFGWLSNGLFLLSGFIARYVMAVAQVCSPAWAWVPITQPWTRWLVYGLCAVAVCGILCRISRRRLLASLAALAVLAGIAIPLTHTPLRVTVVSAEDEAAVVVAQDSHSLVFLTHSGALNEISYSLPPLHPDAVFLGDAAAADAARTDRYPDALWLGTDRAARMAEGALTACPVGSTVTLWADCRLTLLSDTTWLLHIGTASVWISTDRDAMPSDPHALCIYVGATPTTPPPRSYAVACSRAWLRRYRPPQTEQAIYIVKEPLTWIPVEGEWRVSPWR